jgi:hypothetical protein
MLSSWMTWLKSAGRSQALESRKRAESWVDIPIATCTARTWLEAQYDVGGAVPDHD